MSRSRAPDSCAVCGAEIPPNARACPECGADERTGWREQSIYDGLDLPETAYADEDDAGQKSAREATQKRQARFWWIVAVVLLAVVVGLVLLNRFWVAP